MKLNKEQTRTIKRIKEIDVGECDKDFCILCPAECANDPANPTDHWHCPLIDGEICEICCHYDMDDPKWPRGRWPEICSKLKCPHWDVEKTIVGVMEKNHGKTQRDKTKGQAHS